jgi:hypothetical protein
MVMAQARILAGSVLGMLAAMGAVVFVLQGSDNDPLGTPPLVIVGAFLVGGVVLHLVLETVGYRARPVPPGTPVGEATRLGVRAFQSLMFVRMALSEVSAFVALGAAFVLGPPDAVLTYAVGGAVSAVLVLVHVWPWRRPVERTRAALERDGALVPLPGTPGGDGATSVIEEL